jgi:hypothetical protein
VLGWVTPGLSPHHVVEGCHVLWFPARFSSQPPPLTTPSRGRNLGYGSRGGGGRRLRDVLRRVEKRSKRRYLGGVGGGGVCASAPLNATRARVAEVMARSLGINP